MISIIVATAEGGVIGKDGGLPWHLPADLAHFKKITTGHPIIMGRKTHESIGRPLPGRTNIVISRSPSYRAEGCSTATSLDEAIKIAASSEGGQESFIIGGASVYEEALTLADKIYLTRVDARIDGDRFFNFDHSGWKLISTQKHPAGDRNQYAYEFRQYVRRGR